MKSFTTAIALLALLGVASAQVTATTNSIGARQCVECVYWGGNWCPNGSISTLTAANGGCSSTVISTCTSNYATSPAQCVQVTGHATKATCTVPLTLSNDTANTTITYTWTQTLSAASYCEIDLAITDNNNASFSYAFNTTNGTVVAQAADMNYSTYITNVTATARSGSIGTGIMGTGKNSSVSLLLWNQGTVASTVSGSFTVAVGLMSSTSTSTLTTTTFAAVLQVTSFLVASLSLLAF